MVTLPPSSDSVVVEAYRNVQVQWLHEGKALG